MDKKEQLFEVIVGNDKSKIICRQVNGVFQDIKTNCVYGSSVVSYRELMILKFECFECGFIGETHVSGRRVECPRCHTVNDFWLKGEKPPENHREN